MKLHHVLVPALLVSSSAFAADVVVEQTPVPAAVFDWSGAYVGANLGGGFGKFKHPFEVTDLTTTPPASVASGSLDITAGGFLGGVQAGYNWQSGQMVYGVEADFQGSAVKAEDSLNFNLFPGIPGAPTLSGKAGTKLDWFGTVRARIGYTPVDRFMIYATGGLAYGHVKSYIDGTLTSGGSSGSINESASKTKAGWTVGAGAEYAINTNWTLKSEYLYTDLGKATLYDGDLLGAGSNVTLKNDVAFHTVRIGLNYKF